MFKSGETSKQHSSEIPRAASSENHAPMLTARSETRLFLLFNDKKIPAAPGTECHGSKRAEELPAALTVFRKIDGKHLPTKRNGDACKTLCFKLVSELSVYTQKIFSLSAP